MENQDDNNSKRKLALIVILLSILTYFYISHNSKLKEPVKIVKNTNTSVDKSKPQINATKPVEKVDEEYSYSQLEVNNFILDYLEGSFQELKYEIDSECPRGYESDDYFTKYSDAELICRFYHKEESDDGHELNYWSSQDFINGRLTNFTQHLDGAEPLDIHFSSPENISEIRFLIDGGSVGIITFRNNLAVDFSFDEEERKQNIKYGLSEAKKDLFYREDFLNRFSTHYREKLKIEHLLKTLCFRIKHKKSCDIYTRLHAWNYPISKEKIKPLIVPELRRYLAFKNLWK